MYGINKNIISDWCSGGFVGVFMIMLSKLIPALTIAVPYVVGLSIVGQWIVTFGIAPWIEEIFFTGVLLGLLTKKEKSLAKVDDFNRVKMLILLSFFVVGFLLTLPIYWHSGIYYIILSVMSLVIYALWDKIPTLGLNFHIANIIKSVIFGVYHIKAYAGEISTSAIMSVSSTFITAIVVGILAGYLVKWRKSLTASIGLHMCLNALLLLGLVIVF